MSYFRSISYSFVYSCSFINCIISKKAKFFCINDINSKYSFFYKIETLKYA